MTRTVLQGGVPDRRCVARGTFLRALEEKLGPVVMRHVVHGREFRKAIVGYRLVEDGGPVTEPGEQVVVEH